MWETALNSHPGTLAALKGQSRSKEKNNEQPQKPQKVQEKEGSKVYFNDLQIYHFNVSSKMGTILKENVSFRSLPAIREAYHRAFSKDHENIDKILIDEGIVYAAAVTNLLVHKSGIMVGVTQLVFWARFRGKIPLSKGCFSYHKHPTSQNLSLFAYPKRQLRNSYMDKDFEKNIAGLSKKPNFTEGNKLIIDGKMCQEICDSCCHCSQRLILAVHAWIVGHP